MRMFWALVMVLLMGGAAAAFLVRPAPTAPAPAGTKSAGPAADASAQLEKTTPAGVPAGGEVPAPAPISPVDFGKDLTAAINDAVGGGNGATPPERGAAPGRGTAFELPLSDAFPAAKITPSKAERVGDDLVIDGRYRVKGAGTKESPYVVPFDLLMSADVYDPRKGLTKMPQRVAFLSDRWVTLTGYVAFPISSNDPKEMLVMFNQWDGCCIGVPPTAYDAVETKLETPVKGDDRFTTFGTVTGVLKVDPFVDNGWLLGLYVMEHARLTGGKSEPASLKPRAEN
ncbi:MAG: hypothetical protein K2Q09_04390 [Phycisphaerales bacterium]|nr:hypothetical protein [Phycisphaerales bacterium]